MPLDWALAPGNTKSLRFDLGESFRVCSGPRSPQSVPHTAVIHEVRLDVFDGPIELLIYLLRKDELDISEVPIAQLTDQYLAYVRDLLRSDQDQRGTLSLEKASEFILMAIVLVRMKVRSLLPRVAPDQTELGSQVSLDDIVAEFERYQQAARLLHEREEQQRWRYPRPTAGGSHHDTGRAWPSSLGEAAGPFSEGHLAEADQSALVLASALQNLLARLAPEPQLVLERLELRIEERLKALRELLSRQKSIDLLSYLEMLDSLQEIIISFLAALELVRLGEARADQDPETGYVTLHWRETPLSTGYPNPPIPSTKSTVDHAPIS